MLGNVLLISFWCLFATTALGKSVVPSTVPTGKPNSISTSVVVAAAKVVKDAPEIMVMFSPEDNVQAEIVRVLGQATKTIHVQAYLLTNNAFTNALITAHKRGVVVKVLLDEKRTWEASDSDAAALKASGIPVKLETAYDNAHNKVMLIDAGLSRAVLITGSYNFTVSAQRKNAENVLFIRQAPSVVAKYLSQWQEHDKAAKPYDAKTMQPANNKQF